MNKAEKIIEAIETHICNISENGHDISEYINLLYRVFQSIDNRDLYLEHVDWLIFAGEEPDKDLVTNNQPVDPLAIENLAFTIIDDLLQIDDEESIMFGVLMIIMDSLAVCKYCVEKGVWSKLVPEKFRDEIISSGKDTSLEV